MEVTMELIHTTFAAYSNLETICNNFINNLLIYADPYFAQYLRSLIIAPVTLVEFLRKYLDLNNLYIVLKSRMRFIRKRMDQLK